jgi:hypothetical protein
VLFGVGHADVAGLAAVRTIVHAIDGQPYIVLRLAETAEFFAGALRFRLVTLRTKCKHRCRLWVEYALVSLSS